MTKAFIRDWSLTIGTMELTNLDMQFHVKKSLKPEPNTCELVVYNIAPTSRKILERIKTPTVRLEAGYKDNVFQLYLGQVRGVPTTIEGPGRTTVTRFSTGDSETALRQGRIVQSIGPKVPVETALRAIVRALGVSEGNLAQAVGLLQTKGVASIYGPGTVLDGSAARAITDFCRSAQLEWSIQDGRLQILNKGKALESKAVVCSADNGMLGSPTVDGKGIASARMFLAPEIVPGRKVSFQSEGLTGFYRITHVEYIGDTRGNEWYADFHAERL